jgi:UDP-N-acetylmuramoyl-L-alanyl-D-glutamate--2,6-diaminopimelate ligase
LPVPTLGEVSSILGTISHGEGVVVTGVSADSRSIQPGYIFVAIRGVATDGNRFIAEALGRGASAVVSEDRRQPMYPVPWLTVPDARTALGYLAAYFQGFPSRRLGVIGVTGTDGKTTVAHLIASILESAGWPVGLISTVQFRLGDEGHPNDTDHSTPPAPMLQSLLARMVEQERRWVVMEVTSHAMAQMRLAGCDVDIGVFTNLTPEHLNYHGSVERYRQAKGSLFVMLGQTPKDGVPSFGVLNGDDENCDYFRSVCRVEKITYGLDGNHDYRVSRVDLNDTGGVLWLDSSHGRLEIRTPLPGRHNAYNVAAACAVGLRLGIPADVVGRAVSDFPGVPGRLQAIDRGQPFKVFVDFAHTPNGLTAVLSTLRCQTSGRLIVVFGHPGGRDLGNRAALGRVAATLADVVVLTDDDPYDEDPRAILDAIEAEVLAAGRRPDDNYLRVEGREVGIWTALGMARPGDTVLIAGRGHLSHTVVGGQKMPLDDVEVAERALARSSDIGRFAVPGKPGPVVS